jgi:glycine/D-amino acid oxidase-like deaminating enzyme
MALVLVRAWRRLRAMRIVVAGARRWVAQVAYHVELAGADEVVLADRSAVASGSTVRATGAVRQQFAAVDDAREACTT